MKSLKTSTSRAFASLSLALILVIALIGLPVRVFAQQLTTARIQPGNTTPLSLVPTAPSGAGQQVSLTIENVGSVNIGFGPLATVTYATGIVLGPSQQALCTGIRGSLYGIAASSTADLRVVATYSQSPFTGIPQCSITRLATSGGAINTAASTTVPMSDGAGNLVPGNVLFYFLTAAITPNSTSTATAAGTFAVTSNATGLGSIFVSDASKWQLVAGSVISAHSSSAPITIATTSTSDMYLSAPVTGILTGIDFSSLDALSASDTNYITYTAVNLGQSGVGSTAMLAVSDANTTKATGGTALVAFARRTLTVHGTPANLAVVKGDVIRVRATATGTLAGTVTLSRAFAYFTKLS
jgi:hypothetical protein